MHDACCMNCVSYWFRLRSRYQIWTMSLMRLWGHALLRKWPNASLDVWSEWEANTYDLESRYRHSHALSAFTRGSHRQSIMVVVIRHVYIICFNDTKWSKHSQHLVLRFRFAGEVENLTIRIRYLHPSQWPKHPRHSHSARWCRDVSQETTKRNDGRTKRNREENKNEEIEKTQK